MYNRLALIALTTVLSSACTTAPTFNGQSHASGLLRSDTMTTLNNLTRAQGCGSIERVDTSILTAPEGEPGRRSVVERWEAHGCQKTHVYQVTFTEDGQGGTFMNIRMQP